MSDNETTDHELDLAEATLESVDEVAVLGEIADETGETADVVAAQAALARSKGVNFRNMQVAIVDLRKKHSMSRRSLSEIMGWTESRVWYLEQATTSETDQNLLDLRTMLDKAVAVVVDGWTKPTVRTVTPKSPTSNTAGVDLRKVIGTAVAEAVAVSRKSFGEELVALTAVVQDKLDAAKAKKASTKPFAEIIEAIEALQWSAK